MDIEDVKENLRSPEFMAEIFIKRPQLYVGIREPSAEQWRLILDSMSMAATLAGVGAEWSPEDRAVMARNDFGQDKDVLVGLLAKLIAALRGAPGSGGQRLQRAKPSWNTHSSLPSASSPSASPPTPSR